MLASTLASSDQRTYTRETLRGTSRVEAVGVIASRSKRTRGGAAPGSCFARFRASLGPNLFGVRPRVVSIVPIRLGMIRVFTTPRATLSFPRLNITPRRRLRRRPDVHYLRRYRKPWTFLSTDVPGRRRHALATRRRSNSRRKSAEQSQQLRFSTRESRLLVSVTAIWRYWIITTMPGLLFACETCGCR